MGHIPAAKTESEKALAALRRDVDVPTERLGALARDTALRATMSPDEIEVLFQALAGRLLDLHSHAYETALGEDR